VLKLAELLRSLGSRVSKTDSAKLWDLSWPKLYEEGTKYETSTYLVSGKKDWSDDDFFESGRAAVQAEILTDMTNICQGRDPKQMKILEIGCGAGRVTRALADLFGEVHAVDISDEMILQAQRALIDKPNAHVYLNNGEDLRILPPVAFDFAFSYIVFQHIPSLHVIESYVRDVHRVLRPGGLFKFQVQGGRPQGDQTDTWTGFSLTEEDSLDLALRCNFEPRYRAGVGSQYFWLWFFKQPAEMVRYVVALRKYILALERTGAAIQIIPEMMESDAECFRIRYDEQEHIASSYEAAAQEFVSFLNAKFEPQHLMPAGKKHE
jgi:ubiquinone/menaquinone biosynthesis C-methylase UbiE